MELAITEPRFLLDCDSICYGCPEYRHILECDIRMHWGDADENGGVCDTEELCFHGSRNSYKQIEEIKSDGKY